MSWGNRLGWTYAGASAAVFLGILVVLEMAGSRHSAPTAFGLDPKHLAAIDIPGEVRDLAHGDAAAESSGAAHFAAVFAAYKEDPYYFDSLRTGGERNTGPAKAAFEAIQKGALARDVTVFADKPELLINYSSLPELTALEVIGECLLTEGARADARKQHADAQKIYRAVYALGLKLINERIVYQQLRVGIALVSGASAGMEASLRTQKKDGDAERWARAAAWTREAAGKQFIPMWRVIGTIDDNVIGKHNGDVFHFATRAQKERMWRVEAVLKLGRMRFNVGTGGRRGDQSSADAMLKKYQQDSDPHIAIAARAASELTVEQYRTMGQ